MTKVVFSFVAIKPIKAEHPVGSGVIVEYQPGEIVPASDWGRATGNLVENGKIARMAVNVEEDEEDAEGGGESAPAAPRKRKG